MKAGGSNSLLRILLIGTLPMKMTIWSEGEGRTTGCEHENRASEVCRVEKRREQKESWRFTGRSAAVRR